MIQQQQQQYQQYQWYSSSPSSSSLCNTSSSSSDYYCESNFDLFENAYECRSATILTRQLTATPQRRGVEERRQPLEPIEFSQRMNANAVELPTCETMMMTCCYGNDEPEEEEENEQLRLARRNARERERVHQVNKEFQRLRSQLLNGKYIGSIPPSSRRACVKMQKKLSKVNTLKVALDYIKYLSDLLSKDANDEEEEEDEVEEDDETYKTEPQCNQTGSVYWSQYTSSYQYDSIYDKQCQHECNKPNMTVSSNLNCMGSMHSYGYISRMD